MRQRIYCYVDESGQDVKSDYFIVVAVANDQNQENLRNQLLKIETETKIGIRKWHKSSSPRKYQFLVKLIDMNILGGDIFFGRYRKPLPYFLPTLEVLGQAIKIKAKKDYSCIVYIDGIDRKKAKELTNALRFKGIKLSLVKSCRDESEPIIRLADRWAGCIRGAQLDNKKDKNLTRKAIRNKVIVDITKNLPG